MAESKFHWIRILGTKMAMEPAQIDYMDGKPLAVWTIGADFEMTPDAFEIGPELIPPPRAKGNEAP